MAEIQNISIDLVKVHPNNVRKTYNDISSLGVLLYVFYYSKDN